LALRAPWLFGMTTSLSGRVARLGRKPNVSGERGLPKPSIPEARMTRGGVVGDYNRYRTETRHGDPDMAILVVPMEVLEGLRAEGWPVAPGDLGENVTSTGIANTDFRPGRRLQVGSAVLEVAKACEPCDNLFALPYVGTARGPEFLKTMLGRRGWFCRVVEEGEVRVGDPIELATD
jgi:MOSC domain-containing protein YiiM